MVEFHSSWKGEAQKGNTYDAIQVASSTAKKDGITQVKVPVKFTDFFKKINLTR